MKKLLALLLTLLMILPLASCGGDLISTETDEAGASGESTAEPVGTGDFVALPEETKGNPDPNVTYPTVTDRLTQEEIDKRFPIADESLTIEQRRNLCVDFFRFCQTFTWCPNTTCSIGSRALSRSNLYSGFPYQHDATASVYRYLEYYDPETGVLDMKEMSAEPKLFTNQCTWGSFWAWGRVINTSDNSWTATCTRKNGFLPVGPYQNDLDDYMGKGKDTFYVCTTNGKDVMDRSYALLEKADALVNHDITAGTYGAGHIMMVSGNNPAARTVTVIDQFSVRYTRQDSAGASTTAEGRLDQTYTYDELYENGYLPFTFKEFLYPDDPDYDPIEPSEVTASFDTSKDSVTPAELSQAKIQSNYIISDVFLTLTDDSGTLYYKNVIRAAHSTEVGNIQCAFSIGKTANLVKLAKKKDLAPFAAADKFTVTITCQIANGEKITVYTGKLQAQ